MLYENLNWFFDGLGVALGGWLLLIIYRRFVLWRDSTRILRWLEANTQDEPHESHKTLFEISNGTRIPEERVQKACLHNTKYCNRLIPLVAIVFGVPKIKASMIKGASGMFRQNLVTKGCEKNDRC